MQVKTLSFKNGQNFTLSLRNLQQNQLIRQKSPNYKNQNVDQGQKKSLSKKLTFDDINAYALQVDSQKDSQSQIDIDEQNDIVNDLDLQYNLKNLRTSLGKPTTLTHKQRVFRANCNKIQGNNYFKQNNFQDSIDQYKQALVLLNPQQFYNASPQDFFQMSELSSNILFNMGTCYFVLMSYKQAIKYYNQSILIKPTYVKAIQKRAQAKYQLGKFEQALIDLENAHNLDRKNVSIGALLKKVIQKLNKIEHLTQSLSAIKIQPIQNNEDQQRQKFVSNNLIKRPLLSQSMIVNPIIKKNQFHQKDVSSNSSSYQSNNQISMKSNLQKLNKKRQRHSLSPQPITSRFNKNSPKFAEGSIYSKNFYKILVPKKKYTKKSKPEQNKSKSVLMQNKKSLFNAKQYLIDKTLRHDRSKKNMISHEQKEQPNKIWNFVPLAVFTGIGLYHGIRSFLGK